MELRTRTVVRHGDRHRNDRAVTACFSPLQYPYARVHVATAKVNAYLHDM